MTAIQWGLLVGLWVGYVTAPLGVVAIEAVVSWVANRRWWRTVGPSVEADITTQLRFIALRKRRYPVTPAEIERVAEELKEK